MEAFSVFIQHWMKEENDIKKKQAKIRIRQKAKRVCQKIIQSRTRLITFKNATNVLDEMLHYQDGDAEFIEDLEDFMGVVEDMANDFLIYNSDHIYGICPTCDIGLVWLEVNNDFNTLTAICEHCGGCHLALQYMNFDPLVFLNQ